MKAKILSSLKESSRRNNTIADMVQSIIMSRKVSSTACALHFLGDAENESKTRRVERFYAGNYLATQTAIDFLLKFKVSEKCLLLMDRTNWQYGNNEVNYLVIYGVDGDRQSLINVELLDNNIIFFNPLIISASKYPKYRNAGEHTKLDHAQA